MHFRYCAFTRRSRPRQAASLELTVWLGSLAALTAFNIGLWIWIAQSASPRTPYVETQLLLSGVYVAVCGFRSLLPRVDLERVCLWDTWLSAILLGRTVATIAEVCFAVQCGLFLHRLSNISGLPTLDAAAPALVPLVIFAELCCFIKSYVSPAPATAGLSPLG